VTEEKFAARKFWIENLEFDLLNASFAVPGKSQLDTQSELL
jgi:hypothetical protein